MTTTNIARPTIVSPAEWRAARVDLLAAEKEVTQARDALATRRRRLPMAAVDRVQVGARDQASC